MRVVTLVIFACALVVGVLGEMQANHVEAMKKCILEGGLDESAAKDIFMSENEPDQKIKCFHACMGKEMGVMVDGNISKDKIIEMLPADIPNREEVVGVFSKCSEEKGSDDCETAYLVYKCLRDNKVLPSPPPHQE